MSENVNPVSIRIPNELIEWLKKYGKKRGIGWQSALKLILYEKKENVFHDYEKEIGQMVRKTIKSSLDEYFDEKH